MSPRGSAVRGIVIVLASLILAGIFFPADVSAQRKPSVTRNDLSAPDSERFRELSTLMRTLKGQLRFGSNENASATQDETNRYFAIWLEQMTLETTRSALPLLRSGVLADLANIQEGSQAVHGQAINYLLTELNNLARDQQVDGLPVVDPNSQIATPGDGTPSYHNAARHNAVLLLSELNSVESRTAGSSTPASAALPVLRALYEDSDLPDYLRQAALVGINRHARSGISDATEKDGVRAAMVALLETAAPPDGRNEEVHIWFRRDAASILGNLRDDVGQNVATLNALLGVVRDKQAQLSLRCEAAGALQNLTFPGTADFQSAADALGGLALDAALGETGNRSRLRHYLGCVSRGLGVPEQVGIGQTGQPTSILAAASGDDATYATSVSDKVNTLINEVEKRLDSDDRDDLYTIAQDRRELIMSAAGDLQRWLLSQNQARAQAGAGGQ